MGFQIGQYFEMDKQISSDDIEKFAELSGDYNPLHMDNTYAKESIFGQRIAHGMLSASYISTIIGTKFPGNGTIYMQQNLKFKRPVYIGEYLKIRVELVELLENNKAKLLTTIKSTKNGIVIEGEALVKLP